MGLTGNLLHRGRQLKSQISALYHGIYDPRVPWYVKLLALLVVAYVLSPVDLIPDFIPVLGLLDEIILVPLALALIVKLMPEEVMREYQTQQQEIKSRGLQITGILIVLFIWLFLILTCYYLWM